MSASPPYCSEKFRVSEGDVRQPAVLLGKVQSEQPVLQLPALEGEPLGEGGDQAALGGAGQQGTHQLLHPGAGGARVGLALDSGSMELAVVIGVGAEIQQHPRILSPGAAAGQQEGEGYRQGQQQTLHRSSPPTSGVSQGKPTVNTLPSGSRRWAVTQPPWRRTVSRTMDSPRPVPPAARERALSTR